MAGFETYTMTRQAEDVQDEIYNISPVDNPIASMSQTIAASGKLHEWTEDSLNAAGANRNVEGADAPASVEQAAVERSNYCQIMTKTAHITGTSERVRKYGRESEMAYQLELRYKELANDEELAIAGAPGGTRQTGAVGSASVARQLASLQSQLDASVTVDATTYTTVAQLEAGLLDCHQAIYEAGGNPDFLFVDPTNARHLSGMAYASGRTRDLRDGTAIVNVIDLYVSQYGELDVVLDRNMDDAMLLLDFNFLATPVLRPTDDWAIAKSGDSDKRQILRESTFAVLNAKACGMVDSVPTSLT